MDAVAAMQPHSLMDQGQGFSTAAAFACFTVAAAKLGLVFRKIKMQASCATDFYIKIIPLCHTFSRPLETLMCWVSCHFSNGVSMLCMVFATLGHPSASAAQFA